jgi:hypothetical protein
VAEWAKATDAVVSGGLTARVSSGSRQWLTEAVEQDPRMEFVWLERVPSQEFDFDAAIEDA